MDPRDAKQSVAAARGPLVVSGDNPRYFSVAGDSRLVDVTGAHFNNNLQDGLGWVGTAPRSRSGSSPASAARVRDPAAIRSR